MSGMFEHFDRSMLPPVPAHAPQSRDVADEWLAQGLHLVEMWDLFQPGGALFSGQEEQPEVAWICSLLAIWAGMQRVSKTCLDAQTWTERWEPCTQRLRAIIDSLGTAQLQRVLFVFDVEGWIKDVHALAESYDDTEMLPSERAQWSRELLSEIDDAELIGYALQQFLPEQESEYRDWLEPVMVCFNQCPQAFLEASVFIRVQSRVFRPDIDEDPDLCWTTFKFIRLLDLLEDIHRELSFQGEFARQIPAAFSPLLQETQIPVAFSPLLQETSKSVLTSASEPALLSTSYLQKIKDVFHSFTSFLQQTLTFRPTLPVFQPVLGTGSTVTSNVGSSLVWKDTNGAWEARLSLPHPTQASDEYEVTLRVRDFPTAQLAVLFGCERLLEGTPIRYAKFKLGELRKHWNTNDLPTLVLIDHTGTLFFGELVS